MAVPQGPRILVVDDDERLRELLVLVLESAGYTVALAADADSAVRSISTFEPDLVVLDVALGADDGRLLLADIRKRSELPVILISGHGDAADRGLGLRLGADDFV